KEPEGHEQHESAECATKDHVGQAPGKSCAEEGSHRYPQRYPDRVLPFNLVAVCVFQDPQDADREDQRGQRRAGGVLLRKAEEHERRDDDDPAADAEQAGEHACRESDPEPDQYVCHTDLLPGWREAYARPTSRGARAIGSSYPLVGALSKEMC